MSSFKQLQHFLYEYTAVRVKTSVNIYPANE